MKVFSDSTYSFKNLYFMNGHLKNEFNVIVLSFLHTIYILYKEINGHILYIHIYVWNIYLITPLPK